MAYRLIVSDLDDTLLNGEGLLSQSTVEAVQAAQAAGVEVVLASGRMPCAMRAFAKALHVTLPMIAYNGAQLIAPDGNRPLYSIPIAVELAREALSACEAWGTHPLAYDGDDFLTSRDDEMARQYRDSLYGAARMRVTGCLLSECVSIDQPKILAITAPERAPLLREKLQKRFEGRLNCVISRPQYIELTNVASRKERALEELCKRLNAAPQEVIAFGDGQNDIGMIRFAGLGCAMANAREEVRAAADLIAPSNREDGVAQVIMRILNENQRRKGV